MAYNAGEYKPRVGLDSLYIAEISADELGVYTVGTPEYLAPAAEATQAATSNTETIYADDQAFETFTTKGETGIDLKVTNIPLELLARMTGQVFDAASGLFYEHGGVPPYFALMFRSMKSNGSYRYYLYPKVKFDIPDEEAATKAESPDPKLLQINVHAIKTTCKFQLDDYGLEDGLQRIIGDDDITAFDPTDWFTTVQVPPIASESV
jgi:phi13 family phage major tail protein